MQKLLRTIAPIAAAAALAACFPDPALLDDDATDTSAGEDASPDAAPGPDGVEDDGSGECETAADCAHLAGNCLKVLCLANTCATQPDPGASCDDGDPCTKDDLCDGTTCAGAAYTCDDGVACTEDLCDGEGGCTHPVADGFCRIDGVCVTAGETKEDDPCRICEGGQAWSPNDGATCEDGDPCTKSDRCADFLCVGESYRCDDGLWCTTQVCDGVGGCSIATPIDNHCVVGDECVSNGEWTEYGCARCVEGSIVADNEGASCDTGAACREMGRCAGGSCIEKTACVDSDPCTIGYCGDAGQCAYTEVVDGLAVFPLIRGWSRVLSGAPVLQDSAIWSTLRSSFALNLDRLQPASLGVPGLDFLTLATKEGLIVTYNSDGSVAWYRTLSADSEGMSEVSHLNANDHLVVGGIATVNVDFNGLSQPSVQVTESGPFFVASYGATGAPSWVARFTGANSISGLVASAGNGAFLVVEIDQTTFEMAGHAGVVSTPPVAGSRLLVGVQVDGSGKALSARRLVRFERGAIPNFRWSSHGSTGGNLVAAVDGDSSALFLGSSPTVNLQGTPHDRAAIASFDSMGRLRWIREFSSSNDCRLLDWGVSDDGRITVAVDAGGAGVSVRSTTELLATSPRGTSVVFMLGQDGDLRGLMSFDEQVLSVAGSNRAESAIVLRNTGVIAGTHGDGTSFEWSLPLVGGVAMLHTDTALNVIGLAEIHGGDTFDLKLEMRDDMYLWSQSTTDGAPRIGSVDDPMQPIQTTPGRVVYRLTSSVCE